MFRKLSMVALFALATAAMLFCTEPAASGQTIPPLDDAVYIQVYQVFVPLMMDGAE